ncbi:GFA family protein [Rhizobium laguerreae]|uniref:GFA family protein n=1 Tax=Rhizobium laguerreae TaxID=1076926 RepID=UPI0036F199B7
MSQGKQMTDDVVRTGGCLCGRVRYEVRGEPYVSGLCHCATCRKLTGSAYSSTANWHQPQFHMTGEVQTYERRQFCSLCGSRLFFLFDGGVEVFLGTLDQAPYDIKPMLEVWTIRREPWLPPVPGIASHAENPPKV